MSWITKWFRRGGESDASAPQMRDGVARVIDTHVLSAQRLNAERRERLIELTAKFLKQKEFIGRDGFVLTDEMKTLIAAHACIMLLGWNDLRPFRRAAAVSIHARTFGESTEAIGPDGRRYRYQDWNAGRAWQLGIVELAWDAVAFSIANPRDGFNVIYHEFAHVLDGGDGAMGGMPPLPNREREREWTAIVQRAYERLCAEVEAGRPTVLSPYGMTSLVEFFPVATEVFFERPTALHMWDAELFRMFSAYFELDPREYERR